MRRKATLLLLALFPLAGLVQGDIPQSLPYVPGQVIVRMKPASRAEGLQALGYEQVARAASENTIVMEPRDGQSVEAAIAELSARGDVEFAQPNYIYHALRTQPNDPSFASQWYLELIRAPVAWDIDTGLSSETVAIVDSGSDTDHTDIGDTRFLFVAGCDIVDGDSDPTDGSGNGHGNAISGIIGAATNNGTLHSGITWNTKLMMIRVLTGAALTATSLDIDSGIKKAIDNKARVINLSLGFSTAAADALIEARITEAYNAGIIVCAAAGNDGTSPVIYPASSLKTVAVGSTTQADARSSFSNFGAATGMGGIDIMAPGSSVLTLALNNTESLRSGTSFSTPFATAAASLVRSRRPGLSPDDFKNFLRNTAKDIGDAGYDDATGPGRLDLLRLLQVASCSPAYAGPNFLEGDTRTTRETSGGRQGRQALPLTASDSYSGYRNRIGATRGTIQFHFKPSSGQLASDSRFLLTQRGSSPKGKGSLDVLFRSDSRIEYRLNDSGSLVSTTVLNVDQWYHIAVTYGDTGMILFINGDSEASNSVRGVPPPEDTVYIGVPFAFNSALPAVGRLDSLAFDTSRQLLLFPAALFVKIESQSTNATVSSTVGVGWKAFQSETTGISVSIYADNNASGFDGTLLASGLSNDQFENVSVGNLAAGAVYYLYAIATDTTTSGATVENAYAYSTSTITVQLPGTIVIAGAKGSSGNGCMLSRSDLELPGLRDARDFLLRSWAGRLLASLYYLILG